MLAGSPDFIAAGMEGTVKDEVPPATVRYTHAQAVAVAPHMHL